MFKRFGRRINKADAIVIAAIKISEAAVTVASITGLVKVVNKLLDKVEFENENTNIRK
jgi:hypothetical protein